MFKALLVSLLAFLIAVSIQANEDHPIPLHAQLKIGSEVIEGKITDLGSNADMRTFPREITYGDIRVRAYANNLEASLESRKHIWQFTSPDSNKPRVVTTDSKYLFAVSDGADAYTMADNRAVWQVSKKTGNVRKLMLPRPTKSAVKCAVTGILITPSLILVATVQADDSDEPKFKPEDSVFAFSADSGKEVWNRTWKGSTFSEDRGMLMAAAYPNFSDSKSEPLTLCGESVLFCASPAEPIRLLTIKTGKEVDAINRVWEYKRGFVGPSVWRHYIRAGDRTNWGDIDEKQPVKDDTITGKILSGPIVVPNISDRSHSVFVILLRARKEQWGEYTGDSFLLEFYYSYGKLSPVALTPLPQFVVPTSVHALADSVLWGGQNRTLFRTPANKTLERFGMGPGGSDRVGTISWLRQYEAIKPEAWMRSGLHSNGSVLHDSTLLRISGPGFYKQKEDKDIVFPLASVNVKHGMQKQFALVCGMVQGAKVPKTNYRGSGNQFELIGPLECDLGWVAIDGDRLCFLVGSQEHLVEIEFPLAKVLEALKTVPAENSAGD